MRKQCEREREQRSILLANESTLISRGQWLIFLHLREPPRLNKLRRRKSFKRDFKAIKAVLRSVINIENANVARETSFLADLNSIPACINHNFFLPAILVSIKCKSWNVLIDFNGCKKKMFRSSSSVEHETSWSLKWNEAARLSLVRARALENRMKSKIVYQLFLCWLWKEKSRVCQKRSRGGRRVKKTT